VSAKSVVVVGAGIVGLATAFHLAADGLAVTIVDRDATGDKASFGNAAGIAVTEVFPASVPGLARKIPGWLLDPLGPLAVRPTHAPKLLPWLWAFARAGRRQEIERIGAALAALNRRVYDDLVPMLEACGLSGELQRRGALTVYESAQAFANDATEWDFKRRHGIASQALSGDEARELEPALGPIVTRAVLTPQWSHVNDPKALVDSLRAWLVQAKGVQVLAGEVTSVACKGPNVAARCTDGREFSGDTLVVAAGAWSGRLARTIGDRVLIESERGYNTTLPEPGIEVSREIIFAERKFVATPLSIGLRIGGAAEFGGLEAPANYKRSKALVNLASRYFPRLEIRDGKAWAGHRPTTPDCLPVIGRARSLPNVIYAFGHGHLGLTQAATTGRIVADLVAGRSSGIDLSPYSISRFN
jgi:D-amino-acid dehydrogenase